MHLWQNYHIYVSLSNLYMTAYARTLATPIIYDYSIMYLAHTLVREQPSTVVYLSTISGIYTASILL